MSTAGNTATALALGAGGGLLLWYLTRDPDTASEIVRPTAPVAIATTASTRTKVSPPSGRPCTLRLDGTGLTANGKRVDVPAAVALCQAAGRAELAFGADGPATVYVELHKALARAGLPVAVRGP